LSQHIDNGVPDSQYIVFGVTHHFLLSQKPAMPAI
jgi:hypothetical protein